MNDNPARFEYRTFARSLGLTEELMRSLSPCEGISESREIYLICHASMHDRNIKLRDGQLELKRIIERSQDLERWQPAGQWPFPVDRDILHNTLWPEGVGNIPEDLPLWLTASDLLGLARRPAPQLYRANVRKRRFRFTLANCSAELDQLLVNGATIESIAVESRDPQAVREAITLLRLDNYENQSYPLALSRILGLAPMPREDEYG